jgi:hypothetical protein
MRRSSAGSRRAADHEERRRHVLALEHVEHAIGDAARGTVVERQRDHVPGAVRDDGLERAAARRLDQLVQPEKTGGEQRERGDGAQRAHERRLRALTSAAASPARLRRSS